MFVLFSRFAYCQFSMTYTKDTPLMTIHSRMPCMSGRMPTAFSVLRVSPAPMKNSDRVMICFASWLTPLLNAVPMLAALSPINDALERIYVLTMMATINQMMKRGML